MYALLVIGPCVAVVMNPVFPGRVIMLGWFSVGIKKFTTSIASHVDDYPIFAR